MKYRELGTGIEVEIVHCEQDGRYQTEVGQRATPAGHANDPLECMWVHTKMRGKRKVWQVPRPGEDDGPE